MPVSDIVRTVDTAIARLLNAQDPYRQALERLLPRATGFDAAMVRLGLNSYLQTFRALQLQRFVTEDFANPKLLDEFQARPKGGWSKAIGPDLLVHVWAGNVPALPLWSFVSGLLVKAGSIGKVASAEPIFASLFARLLAEVEPRWADCFAVVWWQGGDDAVERCVFAEAEVVLAYGGNTALHYLHRLMPVDLLLVRSVVQIASLVLLDATGPARPVNYSQDISYMKGRAGIVIRGATESTGGSSLPCSATRRSTAAS